MDDFYTEQLIKKQADSKDTLKKAGLIVLTVLSVLLVFAIPVGIIFPVVMIVVDVLVFSNMNVEYEYVFVNGDLDIDKIMNKIQKKKNVFCRCRSDGTSCTGRSCRINAV